LTSTSHAKGILAPRICEPGGILHGKVTDREPTRKKVKRGETENGGQERERERDREERASEQSSISMNH
jgi:hypothetical protein